MITLKCVHSPWIAAGAVFGVVLGLGLSAPVTAQTSAPLATPVRLDRADLSGERVKVQAGAPLAVDQGAEGLAQTLKKLGTRASLMLIVAHPDDEDGGMLAYESRGVGARVAMLTLTRGEGGQNLMSADFNDALGLVRTQELLAAGRYMGVDQMFGTEVDFGFSKTKEESLQQWGHDRVLYDAVRAVRLYRPLVLAAVFVGGLTDGHGQHQVSGEIAQEVYNAAGDPNVFPEMIKEGLAPWTPLKVYARVPYARVTANEIYDYATGKYAPAKFYNYVTKSWSTVVPVTNVSVPEGEFSKVLGMSYVQFARRGLALQKTQIGGGGRLGPAGRFDVSYTCYGSRVKVPEQETGLFEGVDTSLKGIASLAPDAGAWLGDDLGKIQGLVERASAAFSMAAPEKTAPVLAEGLKAVDSLLVKVKTSAIGPEEKAAVLHELDVKRVQFNQALVQALGLNLAAETEDAKVVVAGQTVAVHLKIASARAANVQVKTTAVVADFDGKVEPLATEGPASLGDGLDRRLVVKIPATAAVTRPYFSRSGLEQPVYEIADPGLRDAPSTPNPLVGAVELEYDGAPVELKTAVGGPEPVEVVPAISVAVSPEGGIVPLGEKSLTVTARVKTEVEDAAGRVKLEVPPGWQVEPADAPFALAKVGDAAELTFHVMPANVASGKAYKVSAVATLGGRQYSQGYRAVGYKGLAAGNIYRASTDRVLGVDVKVAPGLKVAYLPGTGDDVEMALTEMGVKATTISVEDVAAGRLTGYDAVVLGVRAYAAHPDLANAPLLPYAEAGGTVIVQYNTGEMPNEPYPLSLGESEKVVDETAKVTLLDPEAQALLWPNRITEADFEGWVEERGHGFASTWDRHYKALTEVHDPDQDPQKGGLLVTETGKGHYVYLAYALYRQLPEGVPGAYRLLANLLSLGRNAAVSF